MCAYESPGDDRTNAPAKRPTEQPVPAQPKPPAEVPDRPRKSTHHPDFRVDL